MSQTLPLAELRAPRRAGATRTRESKGQLVPLDDHSRRFLRKEAELYGDQSSLSITELRELQAVHEFDFMNAAEQIEHASDERIPTPDGDINARLYKPSRLAELPVMLFMHGGGFCTGSLELKDQFCRSISNAAGCAVLSIDYRLAPENPYPAALDDCRAALDWLVEHADVLGLDPRRIAVGGESAGGNLAAALCRAAVRTGRPLAFQCLLCPALDATMSAQSVTNMDESLGVTRSMFESVWTSYRGETPAEDPHVSPLLDREDLLLPPTLIVVGELDPLRDEGIAYANRLMRAGGEVTIRCYSGQLHCFFLHDRYLPRAKDARADIAREIESALTGFRSGA